MLSVLHHHSVPISLGGSTSSLDVPNTTILQKTSMQVVPMRLCDSNTAISVVPTSLFQTRMDHRAVCVGHKLTYHHCHDVGKYQKHSF